MANKSVLVRIPATVGNFAGALNCAALALDASLNVKVTPRGDGRVGIRYFGENGERVPRNRSNLIIRAMEAALHLKQLEFAGADLEIYSSVPVAVGLGSSTAAVLAGLIAADRLFRLELEEKSLFDLASIYEGRGDNLQAAWAGGFVACVEGQPMPTYRRTAVPENFAISVVVPETQLALNARREPPKGWAANENSHINRAAALAEFFARPGKGRSLELDAALPPTCQKAVAGLEEALQIRLPGVLSIFVCGSGPAVAIQAQDDALEAVSAVRNCFARHNVGTTVTKFRPTNAGAREWNAVRPEVMLPTAKALGSSRFPALEKSTLLPV
jgi:homoserine kinase